jgi:hypothetical protein
MQIELEVTPLRDGTKLVRPAGALGTCGWHPKGWILGVMGRRDTPASAFLAANPNWSQDDLSGKVFYEK